MPNLYQNGIIPASPILPHWQFHKITNVVKPADMSRLKELREKSGLTREALAERLGVTATTIYRKEMGIRGIKTSEIPQYAKALGCAQSDFIEDKQLLKSNKIHVVGYVGAGARIQLIEGLEQGESLEEIECPPGMNPQKTVAVIVRGKSMEPLILDGWYLYYDRRIFGVPTEYVGKLCVVKLADSDLVLVKRITNGDKVGHYHLLSYNEKDTPPMNNQAIEWSAKVAFIKPA